jgi:hypothetical protein
MTSIKIALYEENNYHTEILGTFLYYCKINNIDVHYYNDSDMSSFYEHYLELFNMDIPRFKNIELNDNFSQYNYVVIGTMGKVEQVKELYYNNLSKFINIFHNHDDPTIDDIYNTNIKKIVMTPLNISYGDYILPVFRPQKEYKKIGNGKVLCMVGRFKNRDWRQIIPLINNGYIIHIITRRVKMVPKELLENSKLEKNIRISFKKTAKEMANIIERSNYLLCIVDENSWYYKDRLSGIIPLSINYNKPLIISSNLNKIYKLEGVVEYDTIDEIPNKLENIDYDHLLTKHNNFSANIIDNNNMILNNIFI